METNIFNYINYIFVCMNIKLRAFIYKHLNFSDNGYPLQFEIHYSVHRKSLIIMNNRIFIYFADFFFSLIRYAAATSTKYRYCSDRSTLLSTATTTSSTPPPHPKGTGWDGKASRAGRVLAAGDCLALVHRTSTIDVLVRFIII